MFLHVFVNVVFFWYVFLKYLWPSGFQWIFPSFARLPLAASYSEVYCDVAVQSAEFLSLFVMGLAVWVVFDARILFHAFPVLC